MLHDSMLASQARRRAPVRRRFCDSSFAIGAGRRLVVLSTHLDDAVLSLGAFLALAAHGGAEVTVLTVLAGDPGSTSPAGRWDAACGFATAGEAARARRLEDLRACAHVGATPVWLPFCDEQYGVGADDATVLDRVAAAVGSAETVLVPGFPLWHGDHRWLVRLVVEAGLPCRFGCYVEQPYARWHASTLPVDPEGLPAALAAPQAWTLIRPGLRAAVAKHRACRAYVSQLPRLGRRPLLALHLHELAHGGEALAWLPDQAGRRREETASAHP